MREDCVLEMHWSFVDFTSSNGEAKLFEAARLWCEEHLRMPVEVFWIEIDAPTQGASDWSVFRRYAIFGCPLDALHFKMRWL